MRVLLDEHLDHRLRHHLGPHDVVTVWFKRWNGRNGQLLDAAEAAGIEVFVTGDRSLVNEQNLEGRLLAVAVLSAVELPILRHHLPRVMEAIGCASPGSVSFVDCGSFER